MLANMALSMRPWLRLSIYLVCKVVGKALRFTAWLDFNGQAGEKQWAS